MGKQDPPIKTYADFWHWFRDHEKAFFKVLKNQGNVERDFFDKLSPKLNQLREGYWFLAGMVDGDTAELVLTADGVVKNLVFVEELVAAATPINGWKLTALKPALDIKDVNIAMGDLAFNKNNLSFYANNDPRYPDEIDITVVHADYGENNKEAIINGTYIFIDNYLGELDAVTSIDNMQVVGREQADQELIPIEKLKDFVIWRQKEFIEKYEGTRYNTENDDYHTLEATLEDGNPLLAIVNAALLAWDAKASHPWILHVEINYQDNGQGMPDDKTYGFMNAFEDQLMLDLKDADGYLNIGRQTGGNVREVYFACKEFRLPSKVLDKFQAEYRDRLAIDYDLYKDKYWQSFNRFKPNIH